MLYMTWCPEFLLLYTYGWSGCSNLRCQQFFFCLFQMVPKLLKKSLIHLNLKSWNRSSYMEILFCCQFCPLIISRLTGEISPCCMFRFATERSSHLGVFMLGSMKVSCIRWRVVRITNARRCVAALLELICQKLIFDHEGVLSAKKCQSQCFCWARNLQSRRTITLLNSLKLVTFISHRVHKHNGW